MSQELNPKAANDARVLSDETLESVSGGDVRIPSSHAEIDSAWDAVDAAANTNGNGAAAELAFKLGLIPFAVTPDGYNYFEMEKPISTMRNWMHEALEWIQQ